MKEIASVVVDEDGDVYVYEVLQVGDSGGATYRVVREAIELRNGVSFAPDFRHAVDTADGEKLRNLIIKFRNGMAFKDLKPSDIVSTTFNPHFKKDVRHISDERLVKGVSLLCLGVVAFPVMVGGPKTKISN